LTQETMEERFLYHIWDAGHMQNELRTVTGKSVQVKYQGQYNTNRGPDFRNALIEISGELLRGDVEIHLNSNDWIAHNHHEDHYYNQVILHVVLNSNGKSQTIKENGEAVEVLELKNQLSQDIEKLLADQKLAERAEPSGYCDLLSAVDNDTLVSILNFQGIQRFRSKVRRFNAMLSLSDFDQVLYEGIMEALGYDKNKLNMLSLAQALPLDKIKEWRDEGMTALDLISIYCCASGLINRCKNLLKPELYRILINAYEKQRFFARNLEIDWQLFRIRPANHPVYRLIAVSGLVFRTLDQGLLSYVLDNLPDIERNAKKAFASFSKVFSDSVLPGTEHLPKPGRTVTANIYINILLPLLALYYEKLSRHERARQVVEMYSSFPSLQENHITRFMARYLSPAQQKIASSKCIHQQGLIDLFYRYCNYHLCNECVSARARNG